MTEDEKRRQKGDLLLEYNDAEENLAHLREKGKRQAQRIEAVAKWLAQASEHGFETMNDRVYLSSTDATVNVPNDPQMANAMNYAEAAKLVEEIRTAIRKLQELRQRKAALGLK